MTDMNQTATDKMLVIDDFTITETQLWGKNIGQPFSDYPQVYRSIGTLLTFELAQTTPIAWYKKFVAGEPEHWKHPDGMPWSVIMAMALKSKNRVIALNLVDWCLDLAEVNDYDNPIELRREVTNELQAEMNASGDWDRWLCHLAFVLEIRDSARKGIAAPAWADYSKDTIMEASRRRGIDALVAWVNAKQPLGDDEDDEDESDDGESPLEPPNEVATVGV